MLAVVSMLLAVAAYGAFYAAAPGRQSKALGSSRLLLGVGAVLTVAALVLSAVATGSAVGPALVLTVMMAAASTLAMAGPFLLPEAETPSRRSPPEGPDRSPARPPALPPSDS
ncbi:MAG: hypothetical protein AAF170_11175 [Bacteroidota bacterium]